MKLAEYIQENYNIKVNTSSIFDIHVKRIDLSDKLWNKVFIAYT